MKSDDEKSRRNMKLRESRDGEKPIRILRLKNISEHLIKIFYGK